jgi:hypothetical protein
MTLLFPSLHLDFSIGGPLDRRVHATDFADCSGLVTGKRSSAEKNRLSAVSFLMISGSETAVDQAAPASRYFGILSGRL